MTVDVAQPSDDVRVSGSIRVNRGARVSGVCRTVTLTAALRLITVSVMKYSPSILAPKQNVLVAYIILFWPLSNLSREEAFEA